MTRIDLTDCKDRAIYKIRGQLADALKAGNERLAQRKREALRNLGGEVSQSKASVRSKWIPGKEMVRVAA